MHLETVARVETRDHSDQPVTQVDTMMMVVVVVVVMVMVMVIVMVMMMLLLLLLLMMMMMMQHVTAMLMGVDSVDMVSKDAVKLFFV